MMTNFKPVPRSFYARDTQLIARALLGKLLVREWRGQKLSCRITEVESYVGEDDLACHAVRGRTLRTETMYGAAGHAYVYLIYGMYHCLNVVTEQPDFPAAVLIRAGEPLSGIEHMQRTRQTTDLTKLTTGPGRLAQALHITTRNNNEDLTNSAKLYVADDGFKVSPKDITATTRIGIDYAGACALYPWRYYLTHSPYVSKRAA